jgi:hypothetical protein
MSLSITPPKRVSPVIIDHIKDKEREIYSPKFPQVKNKNRKGKKYILKGKMSLRSTHTGELGDFRLIEKFLSRRGGKNIIESTSVTLLLHFRVELNSRLGAKKTSGFV